MQDEQARNDARVDLSALRARIAELEDALKAITSGEVDALVVQGERGTKVFTLTGAEAAYRAIIEDLDEGAATLDDTGVILYANRSLAKMLAATPSRVTGSRLMDWLEDASQAPCAAAFGSAKRARVRQDSRVRRDNGPGLPVLLVMSPMPVGAGAAVALVATDETLVEQQKLQIRAEEARYELMIDSALEGIAVISAEGALVRSNPAFARKLGYSSVAELMREAPRAPRLAEELASITRMWNASGVPTEFQAHRRDGSQVWLSASVRRSSDDAASQFECFVRDISAEHEAKALQSALIEAQADAHIGSWTQDMESTEGKWSDEMWRLFGLVPKPGRPSMDEVFQLVAPAMRERYQQTVRDAIARRESFEIDLQLERSGRWLLNKGAIERNEQGKLVARGTMIDITERKIAEIALQESKFLLDETQGIAKIGSWELDVATGRVTLSRQAAAYASDPSGASHSFEGFLKNLTPASAAETKAELKRVISGGAPATFDVEQRRASGSSVWLSLQMAMGKTAPGRSATLRGTIQDVTERKTAELQLKTANALNEAIVDSLPGAFFMIDPSGRLLRWNSTFRQDSGYSDEEIRGLNLMDLVPPEGREAAAEAMMGAFVTGSAVIEGSVVIKDGTKIPYLIHGRRFTEDPPQAIGFGLDITERNRSEQALAAAKSLSDAIIEGLPGIFYMFGPDGRFLRWNSKFGEVTGFSDDEIGSMNVYDFVSGDDHSAVAEGMKEVFVKGLSVVEGGLVRKGAPPIPYIFGGGRLDGDPPMLVGMGIDNSARKQAEVLLRTANELNEAIIECLPGVFCLLSTDLRILRWNTKFCKLTGYTPGEVDRLSALDLFAPESRERAASDIAKAFGTGTGSTTGDLIKKDGTRVPFLLMGSRFDSDLPMLIALGIDETDRRKTAETLRQSERLRTLGTLVAGVAHEINNPLMYIRGGVELAQMSAESLAKHKATDASAEAEQIAKDLDMAMRGLDRIALITKSLRQVARTAPTHLEAATMNGIIETILPAAKPRIGSNVVVKHELESHATLQCNPTELSQVILNLVLNAGDAMGEKGGTLTIHSHDTADHVMVEVTDTGPGIPEAVRARLFTPFFTTKVQGTGLGLSVSHSIAEEHGGTLTFDSTLGVGTTFTLALPIKDPNSIGHKTEVIA